MKKIKSIIKKLAIIITLLILNGFSFINSVYATQINAADVYTIGDCGSLLKYKGVVVKVSYVEYVNEGIHYPAYCLDKTKPGAETGGYQVSVQEAIQDVGLWRRIIHGYPYQSIESLGVTNKEEAFTATKQAIYCYIHGNNPNDYQAIGEAGTRTLNAMHKIIQEAENSQENKISNTLQIQRLEGEWKQDEKEKNYVSKRYKITANAEMKSCHIKLEKENGQDIGGIKIVDEQNNEKQEYEANQIFKVLVPIKNMTEKGTFKLTVESKIQTKPILYGKAPNSSYQDYALTAATYEDGVGIAKDEYFKNETKIIIKKQDEETKEKLQGVEFELLNENKEAVYQGLKTNEEGKIVIENIVPGRYYIKEVSSIDGYEKYDELIRIDVSLNQQISVMINNKKEEKPKIEITKNEISVSKKEVKKLPVTGK